MPLAGKFLRTLLVGTLTVGTCGYDRGTAPYPVSFDASHALSRIEPLADRLVERLALWHAMIALGLTSTPENPEPTRSDSHAWAAHPSYEMLATVLGVRPASAGFRRVRIAPSLGPLQWAEGRVPHPAGDIDVRVARQGASGVRAVVTLPPGLSGEFVWRNRRVALHAGRQALSL
jgi:alpha-L-rhamnosidase